MKLDLPALESWLWEAACVIRGPVDAPKFKDYILPLIFLKRVSDVFEDEIRDMEAEFGTRQKALKLADADHQLVRFFIPEKARWGEVAKRTKGVGEYLTDAVRAVARVNPRLQGVIDITDFNATTSGQRMLDDDRLASLVQILNQHRLGLEDVEKDILGQAYEYLLRKFAEGQGSSAGEFLTPPEVALLMAIILDPQPGQSVYDSNCGTAGLLIKAHLRLIDKFGVKGNGSKKLPPKVAPLKLFGQEINPSTFAMARMNAFIHDMEAEIALGDTMTNPRFTQRDGSLRRFDRVTANPMWNQKFAGSLYENDTWGRFTRGVPPTSSADWGWIQHMHASLADTGKVAVVLDTGAVSRGSGNQGSNKESDIRKSYPNGVYLFAGAPRLVPFLESDADLTDFFFPNGSFAKGKYECLSYATDNKKEGDGSLHLAPPGTLPKSETQGLGERDEILTALFERTYASLSPCAQRAFMTLAAWNSAVPRVALEAVLQKSVGEIAEVERGIDLLLQYSLAERHRSIEGMDFIQLPLVALLFGRKKLNVSPFQAAIKVDADFLQMLPLQECSGSFSLSGIKVQPTQMEEDVGLETLFVPIPKGLFDQPLDFIV
jgi:type I restriction enzyme M protein